MHRSRGLETFLAVVALVSLLAAPVAAAGRRVALVIGNNSYRHTTPLRNCVNDARAVGTALEALGFLVQTITDAERPRFDEGFGWLEKESKNAELGVVFYSGHGVAVGGVNYLLPVEANPESESQIKRQGFNASEIASSLQESGCKTSILILDACRNNPFERRFRGAAGRGLAQMEASPDSLIAFAADAGQVADDNPTGDNGLYTAELIRHLRTPGIPIEDVFKRTRAAVLERSAGKQVPAEYSKLTKDIVLVAVERPVEAAAAPPAAPAPVAAPAPTLAAKPLEWQCESNRQNLDKAVGVWESINVAIPTAPAAEMRLRRDGTIESSGRLGALTAPPASKLRAGSSVLRDMLKEPLCLRCPFAPEGEPDVVDYVWSIAGRAIPELGRRTRGTRCLRCERQSSASPAAAPSSVPPTAPTRAARSLARQCQDNVSTLENAWCIICTQGLVSLPDGQNFSIDFGIDGSVQRVEGLRAKAHPDFARMLKDKPRLGRLLRSACGGDPAIMTCPERAQEAGGRENLPPGEVHYRFVFTSDPPSTPRGSERAVQAFYCIERGCSGAEPHDGRGDRVAKAYQLIRRR